MRVVPLTADHYHEAGVLLAQAFANDPLTVYTIPRPERRRRTLEWAHEHWAAMLAGFGGFFATDGLEGVAGWLPPQHNHSTTLWHLARAGFLMMPFRFGLSGLGRALHAQADVQHRYREEVTEPHWILDVLGVAPAHQGRGVASCLINHVLAMADGDHLPCYVVTHNPRNIVFYERFGFQLLTKTPLAEGVFTCSLRRPAR